MMIMTPARTKTDVPASEWMLDDAVIQLREWGTDSICALPEPQASAAGMAELAGADGAAAPDDPVPITIGAAESCTLRLEDPEGRISRVHAELLRRGRQWLVRDLGSKNGLRIDGARRFESLLQPGTEIGIGPRTLIAESARSIALQAFLARVLGWRRERIDAVDHALRSMRMAATRRGALMLCGDGDLVPLAHSLHRHSLGADRPFIVCDPRRRRGKATVRAAENFDSGMAAYKAAAGGSLCVRGYRLPKDFHEVVNALRSPESRVQLIVCSPGPESDTQFLSVPVYVPPLASRLDEIDRIIGEYAEDAISDLRAARAVFTDTDREWVRMYSAKSLPDIEKGALRLIAINLSPNVSNAAERLGMAPVSLSRWIGRRKLPVHLER